MAKFGKKFPAAKNWWKQYKLKQKVKRLEKRIAELESMYKELEIQKNELYSAYIQEINQQNIKLERTRMDLKAKEKELLEEETTLQEGSYFRKAVRYLKGEKLSGYETKKIKTRSL